MNEFENLEVAKVFNSYPTHMRQKLLMLRQLVLETASESEGIDTLEETPKVGRAKLSCKEWERRSNGLETLQTRPIRFVLSLPNQAD